jgi:hypothetical protein
MATLGLKEMGKFLWEGMGKNCTFKALQMKSFGLKNFKLHAGVKKFT